jgi:hypothetical protein
MIRAQLSTPNFLDLILSVTVSLKSEDGVHGWLEFPDANEDLMLKFKFKFF